MNSAALETSLPQLAIRPARRRVVRSASPALVLVANPHASGIAGNADAVADAARALRSFGGRVETRQTETLDELADVFAHEPDRIVLLGGDGSVHAAANVTGPKPELALLPAGKANNLARALGVPVDLTEAARLAVAGRARRIDAIAATTSERRYLAVEGVSVGFHAQARAQYRAENSGDLLGGIAVGARALAAFAPVTIGLESDGRGELRTVSQMFVSNFPLFAFGLRVAPAADPSDGRLDVVSIGPRGRAAMVGTLAQLRKGTHVGRPGVEIWRAARVRITTRGRSPIIADTTNLGSDSVELTVQPGALEVVAP